MMLCSNCQLIFAICWTFAIVTCDDESICDDNDDELIPHPGECQLFYDCRYSYVEVPPLFEDHLFECPYPLLFSEESKTCDWFEYVDCGERQEPVSGCDYRTNQDPSRRPCSMDFPYCNGLPDGANVIESKLFTSSYAVCYKDRFLYEGQCPSTSEGALQIFDPNNSQCTPLSW